MLGSLNHLKYRLGLERKRSHCCTDTHHRKCGEKRKKWRRFRMPQLPRPRHTHNESMNKTQDTSFFNTIFNSTSLFLFFPLMILSDTSHFSKRNTQDFTMENNKMKMLKHSAKMCRVCVFSSSPSQWRRDTQFSHSAKWEKDLKETGTNKLTSFTQFLVAFLACPTAFASCRGQN